MEKNLKGTTNITPTQCFENISLSLPCFHGMAEITFWYHPLFRRHSQSLQSTSPLQCLRILQCHSSSPWLSAKWSHRNGSANLTSHYPAQNPLWTEMSHRSEKIHSAMFQVSPVSALASLSLKWSAYASGTVPSCIVQDNNPAFSLSGQESYLHALTKAS